MQTVSMLINIDTIGNGRLGNSCPMLKVMTRMGPYDDYKHYGPLEMYDALSGIVSSNNLEKIVTLKKVGCLSGCTFGPRIDVTVKSQDKTYTVLYGGKTYRGEIYSRGYVSINGIAQLESLQNIIYDNL